MSVTRYPLSNLRLKLRWLRVGLALALVVLITGCAALYRNPVPGDRLAEASIPGMPAVRAWSARFDLAIERDLEVSFAQERAGDFPQAADGVVTYPHLLLSGGGANGAFGAGFLSGWTASGGRPLFKIVTGVSTGALMAPFAFLGADYDDALREFYTTTATRDVLTLRSLLPQLLAGEALASTGPLAAMIARYVDEAFLDKIAAAHGQGRRLYVGTVDLDAQQFVVWNMGLIATTGGPEALYLFRQVMLASSSIPVAFPPVLFEVEVDGRRYDEMHVDGGVIANVFFSAGVFRNSIVRERGGLGIGREDFYVIHNGLLTPRPKPIRRNLRAISARTLESAGKASMVGDLFRIYAVSMRERSGFRWVTMPRGFEVDSTEFFDPVRMGLLYDLGYRMAREGPIWITDPPGVSEQQLE